MARADKRQVTKDALAKFKEAKRNFDWFGPLKHAVDPFIVETQYKSLCLQIKELEDELAEMES